MNTCFGEIGVWRQKSLEATQFQDVGYQSFIEIISKNEKILSKNVDVIRRMIRIAPQPLPAAI